MLLARSAHRLLAHLSSISSFFQAWRTTLVGPLKGKLILNFVKCNWLRRNFCRGTFVSGPSTRTYEVNNDVYVCVRTTIANRRKELTDFWSTQSTIAAVFPLYGPSVMYTMRPVCTNLLKGWNNQNRYIRSDYCVWNWWSWNTYSLEQYRNSLVKEIDIYSSWMVIVQI